MKRSNPWLRLLAAVPLLLGTAGFLLAGTPILDAVFRTVTMYAVNYSDSPPNALAELARWTAPLATAGGVLAAASSLRRRVLSRRRARRGDSVAVFGDDGTVRQAMEILGARGVSLRDGFLNARRYLLLGSESENIAFYRAHADEIGDRPVYLRSESLSLQTVARENLHPFSPEENAARLFWRDRNVYSLWKRAQAPMRIVLLGFGRLGEALVFHGLQMNLFAADQQIEYHVFGDCAEFLAEHPYLHMLTDRVIAHAEPWYDALPLLDQAELVLLCEQTGQIALARKLLAVTVRPETDVFLAGDDGITLLEARSRLRCFDWLHLAMAPEVLFDDALCSRAKAINLRYAHLYGGVEETPEQRERQWRRLDAFTRGSNVSAADYQSIRFSMLRDDGLPTQTEALSPEQLERLAVLEHVRWCRWHWLNNWRYGEPEGGVKDASLRIHRLLVPYAALSEAEKEKDRENIRVMMHL